MNISIADFKDILVSKSGGKPLSKVQNFYSMLFQAMLKVKEQVDLPSGIRTVQLTNAVYTNIKQYSLPSDIGLNAIIALRAINPSTDFYDFSNINMRQSLIEQKYGFLNRLAVRYVNGVPYLLLDLESTAPVVINACDSLTGNGTISAIGAVTGISTDILQFISSTASLTFSVGVGSSNGIAITGMAAVDLSAQRDVLAYVFLPTLSGVTGVKIGVGQNATSYFISPTITTDFFGSALKTGWNLVRVPKTAMTIGAGSPAYTGVTYMRYEIVGTFAAVIPDFKIDSVVGQLGALYEIDYYSELNFKTLAGTYIQKPTLDTDYLALTTSDEINLFTDQFIAIMSADLKQQGVAVDMKVYGGVSLEKAYENFKIKYPSQRQLVVTDYASRPRFDL